MHRFLRNPAKPVILAMSRPDAKKNVTALVRAYGGSAVLRRLANLVLVLVREGEGGGGAGEGEGEGKGREGGGAEGGERFPTRTTPVLAAFHVCSCQTRRLPPHPPKLYPHPHLTPTPPQGNRDAIDSMAPGSARVMEGVLKLVDGYDLYGSVAYPKVCGGWGVAIGRGGVSGEGGVLHVTRVTVCVLPRFRVLLLRSRASTLSPFSPYTHPSSPPPPPHPLHLPTHTAPLAVRHLRHLQPGRSHTRRVRERGAAGVRDCVCVC